MISIILNGKEIKINKQISVQQLLIKENLEKKNACCRNKWFNNRKARL